MIADEETRAQELYSDILKRRIYPMVGNKTTYLTQLLGVGRKLFGVKFKGVFPSDKIPRLNDLSPYCILNLDRSGESGSHWIALVKTGGDSIVYDSFGRDYKRIIPDLDYSGNGKIRNTDDDSEQKILQTDCGARCLAFLMLYDKYGASVALLI